MFRLMGKEESDMKNFIVKNGPGFLVCLVIAVIAQGIARLAPAVGAALFAIGLGIVCGNTFLNKPCFDAGTKFSERNLLEYSIVLTGATLLLGDILALGLPGLGFIACQMGLTILAAYWIGRKLGFGKKFTDYRFVMDYYDGAARPPLPRCRRSSRRRAKTRGSRSRW